MPTPHGQANENYRLPCPGCMRPVLRGQLVIQVALATGSSWWHQSCRREYVKVLCL